MIVSNTKISYEQWGQHAGEQVCIFKMENEGGAYVELTNYGATLVSAVVPDARGQLGNTVLGFKSLQAYIDERCYIGATIGRYANRISGAKFKLDGTTYHLENNDGKNTNHGGNHGFNSRVFKYAITADGLFFTLLSKDGDGGFPGNLELTVNYHWTDLNELIITYFASTDKKTVASFTNHAYFNLSGKNGKIYDHLLTVYADQVLDNDADYVPTGLIKSTGKIAFDGIPIRNKMKITDNSIVGLNDCYVLNEQGNKLHKLAAKLFEKESGRKLEVYTTYPAVMVYTGDYLQSEHEGHNSRQYGAFEGLCLECQHYPDSPNHSNFPSTVLDAEDVYQETIAYKFSHI
ncbi:aldose epimerase family protein [Mucilaginibacter sp. SP1R1]|uniref:aldose epimerase family protein n=1 Tax=Mucilaginibacter sp. SP1R1 TaxID=2723091 RepID=UPI0016159386|nr:aldose epimerase family protein [Mucilaginibacter sp. SP1R1]MBB6147967.1 aldose 1-epimerase [Mucilaginibacter sp. SP1R1]